MPCLPLAIHLFHDSFDFPSSKTAIFHSYSLGQKKPKYFSPDELMSKLSSCLECLEERQQTPSCKSSGPGAKRPPCHSLGNISKSGGTLLRDAPKSLLVTKWVDYSNKYGFGAQLSDGSVTVRFNDCTKIALSPGKRWVQFPLRPSLPHANPSYPYECYSTRGRRGNLLKDMWREV